MKFEHNCTLFGNDGKVCNGIMSHLRKEESTNPAFIVLMNESNCATKRQAFHQTDNSSLSHHLGKSIAAKRAKCMMKTSQGFPQFSSDIEVRKISIH